jgi:hypothetical protein
MESSKLIKIIFITYVSNLPMYYGNIYCKIIVRGKKIYRILKLHVELWNQWYKQLNLIVSAKIGLDSFSWQFNKWLRERERERIITSSVMVNKSLFALEYYSVSEG